MKAEVAIATEMNTPLFPSRIIANMSHALPKNSNASFVVIRDVSKLFSSNPAGAIGEWLRSTRRTNQLYADKVSRQWTTGGSHRAEVSGPGFEPAATTSIDV
ncbi:MAG: hypothetical protein IPL32_19025 [Chloracidobacterium sp.]|nr:hypothetical protein [Chloracidobacterium sp.]